MTGSLGKESHSYMPLCSLMLSAQDLLRSHALTSLSALRVVAVARCRLHKPMLHVGMVPPMSLLQVGDMPTGGYAGVTSTAISRHLSEPTLLHRLAPSPIANWLPLHQHKRCLIHSKGKIFKLSALCVRLG
jgi:hypothetical protein